MIDALKRHVLPISTFVRIDVKRLFRDRVAIFFVFVFPLIFLMVFGGIFGRDSNVSFKIAVLNNSNTEFAKTFVSQVNQNELFKVEKDITTLDEAKQKMNRSELDAVITLPENFGAVSASGVPAGQAKVLYDQNNEQAGQSLTAVLNGVFEGINNELIKAEKPFTVTSSSTATKGQTRFDYIFAGLLGFSILSLGIFGPTSVFPRMKQRGVLRRYQTTTLRVWQYFVGNVLSNAFIGLLSVMTMFVTALVFFDLNMRGDYISLFLLVVLGTITLFGIGLAVGGWAKNENQAAPLANLISFPMMFLSGTFFPRFLMPEWLQTISGLLPLTPVIDGVRLIVTEGKTIIDIAPQVGLLAAWALVIYVIAFRVFRWE